MFGFLAMLVFLSGLLERQAGVAAMGQGGYQEARIIARQRGLSRSRFRFKHA